MQYILLLWLSILSLTVYAEELQGSCNSPQVNRQCEEALQKNPKDPRLAKLYAIRTDLCGMVVSGKVDLDTAKSMWEQALLNVLSAGVREEPAQQRPFRVVFGTF